MTVMATKVGQTPRRGPKTKPTTPSPDVDWQSDAACLDEPPELFFSFDAEDQDAARVVCAGCPVRHPCLGYALTERMEGIWGGTDTEQRRLMLRRAAKRRKP